MRKNLKALIACVLLGVPLAIFFGSAILEGRWRDAGEASPIVLLLVLGVVRLYRRVVGRR